MSSDAKVPVAQRVYLLAGLFFMLFSPHVILMGYTIKTVYVFVVVPAIIGAFRFLSWGNRDLPTETTAALIAASLVYHTLLSAVFSFQDTSVITQCFMGLTTFFAAFYYVGIYDRLYPGRAHLTVFKDLYLVGIIHSVIIIATFLMPEFKEFLYRYIAVTDLSKRYMFEAVQYPRFQGIAGSGFAALSTKHALLLVIGIWTLFMEKGAVSLRKMGWASFSFIIMFIAIMLIGRTGLIVVLLSTVMLVLLVLRESQRSVRMPTKLAKLVVSFVLVIAASLSIVDIDEYERNIEYAFELYYSMTGSGELDKSTANVVKYQFVFPSHPSEMLFGTGNFGRGDNFPYIRSDVGYVLFVTGGGIIGMMVAYLFLLPGLVYSRQYRLSAPAFSWIFVVFVVVISVVNLKDAYYFAYGDVFQLYFIAICALGSLGRRRVPNSERPSPLLGGSSID